VIALAALLLTDPGVGCPPSNLGRGLMDSVVIEGPEHAPREVAPVDGVWALAELDHPRLACVYRNARQRLIIDLPPDVTRCAYVIFPRLRCHSVP
jgi:hypothetical protein